MKYFFIGLNIERVQCYNNFGIKSISKINKKSDIHCNRECRFSDYAWIIIIDNTDKLFL